MKRVLIALIMVLMVPALAISAKLTWDHDGANTEGYRLYYGFAADGYPYSKDLGKPTGNEYPMEQLNLNPGQTYYMTLTAYNEAGESDQSNSVTWTEPIAPEGAPSSPPQNVQIVE